MTTSTISGPMADVRDMYVVHRVFRREFTLLPRLVREVTHGDTARARVLAQHLRLVLAGLHLHHTGEDELLWPLLLERAAPSADLIHTMQAQHARVEEYSDRLEPLIGEWESTALAVRAEQLARLVDEFWAALLEHLELEEREILPLASRHVTAAEWELLAQHGNDEVRRDQLPLLFGSLLEETTEEERAMMLGKQPLPIRLLLKWVLLRQYRRYINRVRHG